jgi:hypothetical protein
LQVQQLEAALRQTSVADPGYSKLARLHRQFVALAATLATDTALED